MIVSAVWAGAVCTEGQRKGLRRRQAFDEPGAQTCRGKFRADAYNFVFISAPTHRRSYEAPARAQIEAEPARQKRDGSIGVWLRRKETSAGENTRCNRGGWWIESQLMSVLRERGGVCGRKREKRVIYARVKVNRELEMEKDWKCAEEGGTGECGARKTQKPWSV